jgi:hypothetical protein
MNKLNDLYNFVTSHKAAIGIACGWFIHMGFPALQRYCQSRNGGTIPNLFFRLFGKPISSENPPAPPAQPKVSP